MFTARSSSGCWTCRVRKKKCQEERPACSTCESLHIVCHGYGKKPAWMDGGQSEKAEAECIKRSVQENNRHRKKRDNRTNTTETTLLSAGNRAPTKSSRTEMTSPAFSSARSTSVGGTSMTDMGSNHELSTSVCLGCSMTASSNRYYGREATLLMHYLDVVFPLQFRFYQPLVSEGGRGWLLSILLHTKPLFHAAVSLSAYHQSSINPYSETEVNGSGLVDMEKHHCLALVELRNYIDRLSLEIGSGLMKTKVEILACMIYLISFEVFKGDSNDWQTHLQAARTIFMDLKDNFLTPADLNSPKQETGSPEVSTPASLSPDENSALEFFATALVWFDILSSATTGVKPEYSNVYSSLLDIESGRIQLCKLMGCQNWVMVIIMDIALLAEWKSAGESCSNLSHSELAKRAAAIVERLENGILKNRNRQIGDKSDPCGVRALESKYVTHIFACAAKVYVYVIQSGAHPRIAEIKDSVSEALKAFRNVPDVRWVRHLVWPFCVVGCMAEEEHEDDFRQIASLASMDGERFCNFQNALSIMEECWRGRKSQASVPWSWATAMSSLGITTLLI